MPRTEEKFRTVSLPKDLVEAAIEFIRRNPELGYTSLAEFVKEAIRTRIDIAAAIDKALQRRRIGPRVPTGQELHDVWLEAVDSITPEPVTEIRALLEQAVQDYERHLRALAERGGFPPEAVDAEVARFRTSTFTPELLEILDKESANAPAPRASHRTRTTTKPRRRLPRDLITAKR